MKKFFPVLEFINVPNLVTTAGLIFGLVACYYIIEGDLRGTYICLFFSALLDSVDGFLAGKLNQKTRFGQYMDSLVDFFICCIMPVWMCIVFVGNDLPLTIAAVFYCVCGLWRLAYYNVTASENRSYFTGLPVPSGLLLTGMAIWLVVYQDITPWFCAAIFILAGLMMISSMRLEKYGLWQKALCLVGLGFFVMIAIS